MIQDCSWLSPPLRQIHDYADYGRSLRLRHGSSCPGYRIGYGVMPWRLAGDVPDLLEAAQRSRGRRPLLVPLHACWFPLMFDSHSCQTGLAGEPQHRRQDCALRALTTSKPLELLCLVLWILQL